MSNNKQTSVEQLFHKLWDEPKDKFTWYAILEKHIAMHKEETIEFAINFTYGTKKVGESIKKDFIKLYNKTFGGNNEEK